MKKAILYVFSGTGNTKNVADEFKKNLMNYDIETTIYMISDNFTDIPNPNNYDIIGVGYPIHAFNAPQLVINFAKALPDVEDKYTFIFKTSGEPLKLNDASSTKLIKVLKKKGYDVCLERHAVMPYNMIFRHNDDMAKQLWVLAKHLTRIYASEVAKGKREKIKYPRRRTFMTYPFRIEWYGAKFNGKLYKVDMNKCINCMKCVNACPTHNIQFKNGKFVFGNDCIMCVRCSFNCPTNAISIGLLDSWKVNGSYKLKQLELNKDIKGDFINSDTRGVCKKVYKAYVDRSQEILVDESNNARVVVPTVEPLDNLTATEVEPIQENVDVECGESIITKA